MTSAEDIAKWMLSELEKDRILYQETAVCDIQDKFGESFVYYNQNGNQAISKEVLSEFRKLTGDNVVWVRGERYWRFREREDDPGRRQEG
jgi:hypothetical protein